jgi:hypothetical protein
MGESGTVKEYLQKIGKKGGQVTGTPKGFASGDNAKRAVEVRWEKYRAAKKTAKKKAAKKAKG